jgi:hypothetical protein
LHEDREWLEEVGVSDDDLRRRTTMLIRNAHVGWIPARDAPGHPLAQLGSYVSLVVAGFAFGTTPLVALGLGALGGLSLSGST